MSVRASAELPRRQAPTWPPRLTVSPARHLRVVDIAMFYGERSGGIRTYLEAKASFAAETGQFEHHLVIPGKATCSDGCGRHEHRSLELAASNGYRVPLGRSDLRDTLCALEPDLVLMHDPFWTPRTVTRGAHQLGAAVIAVHHSSAALHAAGLPGPHAVYERALRRWYRRAYHDVDAVMSVVDPALDTRRSSTLALRLGLDPAFAPRPDIARDDHVLYVGRLSREKGLRELLEAASAASDPWPLVLVGTGPMGPALRERARQLGLDRRISFEPYVADRGQLAERFASARCAVLPGAHETFGLAALEAAACGTAVVTADTTPSATLLNGFVHTFRAGDSQDLLSAIERARTRVPEPDLARALTVRYSWDRVLSDELADLRRLLQSRDAA